MLLGLSSTRSQAVRFLISVNQPEAIGAAMTILSCGPPIFGTKVTLFGLALSSSRGVRFIISLSVLHTALRAIR